MSLQESNAYVPNNLISGDAQIVTEPETLASGQDLTAGAVLGRIGTGAATFEADGGNTGDGTVTGLAKGALAVAGDYVLECVAADTDAGTFSVTTPDGDRLDDAEVGVAYENDHLAFTITDDANDWIVGDKITVSIADGSGEWTLSLAAALDGSQTPRGILAADADASDGALVVPVYKAGMFDPGKLTIGTSHTAASVKTAFEGTGLFVRAAVEM